MDGYEAAISLAREAQPTVRYEYEYRGVSFDQGRVSTHLRRPQLSSSYVLCLLQRRRKTVDHRRLTYDQRIKDVVWVSLL